LGEVAGLFLKLGMVAFGGPAAHVALMRREVVERRRWLQPEEFARMFAACNLVPGPSSTELAIFIGYRRAGWRALVLAGVLFILPAMLLMGSLAWVYTRFGDTRPAVAILAGVRPVIVGIVAWATLDLARRLVRQRRLLAVSVAAAIGLLFGLSPIWLLAAGGVVVASLRQVAGAPAVLFGIALPALGRLPLLFLTFLKIGAVSLGSGYVLLPLLRADLVEWLHWITESQLLDAVALGQATPGPVFTTATFLGYLVAGPAGAVLATLAIFLPGFLLVPFLDRLLGEVERRPGLQAFADGANAAAVGLIAATVVVLGRPALADPVSIALAVATFALLIRWPLASPVAVALGAMAGLLRLAIWPAG
jgi:chromate transporter